MSGQEIPLACVLDAIPADQQARHQELFQKFFQQNLQAKTELENGFAFSFPLEHIVELAEYITMERLCCPFLTFTIQVEPLADTVSLQLTGRDGTKELLQQLS